MINPFQAMGMMQNPMGMLQQQMLAQFQKQNPQMYQQVQQMVSGKSDNQLKEMAQNIANERGINLQQFASRFGITL